MRDGANVAELTHVLDEGWPEGMRETDSAWSVWGSCCMNLLPYERTP